MRRALIGHTGFVGGNLLRHQVFDDHYNSKNIHTISGKHYGLLVCAGAPAAKWIANKEPDNDRRIIQGLCAHLNSVRADKFVLISTVDVYPFPVAVDEATPIDPAACQPYGRHRLELERFVSQRFDALIIRLPGLFGSGLKKNVIFDFLHHNNVDQINPKSIFQFYSLDHLSNDMEAALRDGLALLNVATGPTSVAEIARICLGHDFENPVDSEPAQYDFRSRHAAQYGGRCGYLYDKATVLDDLETYVARGRWGNT